jgi:hypothetical protein
MQDAIKFIDAIISLRPNSIGNLLRVVKKLPNGLMPTMRSLLMKKLLLKLIDLMYKEKLLPKHKRQPNKQH